MYELDSNYRMATRVDSFDRPCFGHLYLQKTYGIIINWMGDHINTSHTVPTLRLLNLNGLVLNLQYLK